MSAWKLVEAEAEVPDTNSVEGADARIGGGRGRGRGRGNATAGRGVAGRGRGGRFNGNYRSKADRSYFAYLAVQQIDLIFNPDSLCIDTYVRSYMDEAGYVPIALVCNYYSVACYGCSYYDIVNKLKEVESRSKYYELDAENETVRLKEAWEKFVMPNPYGGRGLPRYIKQAYVAPEEGAEGEVAAEADADAAAETAETAEAASSEVDTAAATA